MERLSVREFNELNRKTLAWLQDQSVDMRLELIQNHLSLCQLLINELLEEEVIEKAGKRYTRYFLFEYELPQITALQGVK